MKLTRLASVGLAGAGLIGFSLFAYAAGIFPDYPVVGGATYCAGNTQSVSGTYTGSQTGCPNQVPAGPSIVTGNEQIAADTRLANGVAPQTVLIGLASLNSLPITVQTAATSISSLTGNVLSAANTSGGVYLVGLLTGTAAVSALNVTLPTAPIDGQQFAIGSNVTINALSVTASLPASVSVSNTPTVLTRSTTSTYGYRFMYNASGNIWLRLL